MRSRRDELTPVPHDPGTVRQMIFQIGDDPSREGLKDTPERVLKAWQEMFAGYRQNPKEILSKAQFIDGACRELVIVKDIYFWSHCEHHLVPFFGSVDIGYVPQGKVVGLSKLARLVDCFAKRLQIQERMTAQIADALMEHLSCKGCMVIVTAKHLCMMARGVKRQESKAVTSGIRGIFMEDTALRAEFLQLKRS